MTDEIMVPMAILGAALLLYVGFFTAMREWIQSRIGGGKSGTTAPSGPPSSTVNPNLPPYQQPPLA